jgi:uncharacterized protein with GYD domain
MSGYFMLVNLTDQGIRTVKDSPQRQSTARDLAQSCEVELKDIHLTMGEYDFVCTLDASDDAAVARFALALGSLGNARTTTLKSFTEQEYRDIIASLP